MLNTWEFMKTHVLGDKFIENTKNDYMFIAQKPRDGKNGLPDGVVVTLMILFDTTEYKPDKNGNPRDNNVYQLFDAHILNGKKRLNIKKGEHVRLIGFDDEHSMAINFDLIMRFKDIEIIQKAQSTQVPVSAK